MGSLSSDCVSYLRAHGRKLRDIAELLDVSESYISRVARGEREFTLRHLDRLEQALGKPVPLLLLEAMRKEIAPDFLPAYEKALRLLEGSAKLRAEMRAEERQQQPPARSVRSGKPRRPRGRRALRSAPIRR